MFTSVTWYASLNEGMLGVGGPAMGELILAVYKKPVAAPTLFAKVTVYLLHVKVLDSRAETKGGKEGEREGE